MKETQISLYNRDNFAEVGNSIIISSGLAIGKHSSLEFEFQKQFERAIYRNSVRRKYVFY
jgi:hypothetical protein